MPLIEAATAMITEKIRELLKTTETTYTSPNDEYLYHHICLKEHIIKVRTVETRIQQEQNNKPSMNQKHIAIIRTLRKVIEDEITECGDVLSLKELYGRYEIEYQKTRFPDNEIKSARFLKEFILNEFPDVRAINIKHRVYIHHKDADQVEVIYKCCQKQGDDERIKSVAMHIRKDVLNCQQKKLPSKNIRASDIIEGECCIPEKLQLLIQYLVAGQPQNDISERKRIRIESICNNIIYCATSGAVKPSQHIVLSMMVKSSSGRRQLPEILNRLGHCLNYTASNEIETELAYSDIDSGRTLPASLIPHSDLCTHLSFDNYDRFVDTRDGKDTLHDTVGIVVQNSSNDRIMQNNHESTKNNNSTTTTVGQRRRRQFINEINAGIHAYQRTNAQWPCLQPYPSAVAPPNLQSVINLDRIWMLEVGQNMGKAYRWFSWNSTRIVDQNPKNNIAYLPQINMSPTSDTVVKRTLEIALKVANDCNQEFIQVTYDLGIANKAYRIQMEQSPTFDRVFIALGAFHIEKAFFKAIGKFIKDSGLDSVLVESTLIARGSLPSVLAGNNFNRCKKLHVVAATALKYMHFLTFLSAESKSEFEKDMLLLEIRQSLQMNIDKNDGVNYYGLDDILEKYDAYYTQTRQGLHGKTAKFATMYIHLVDLYLLLERGLRTSDLELYVHTLEEMNAVFFALNHQNYARYLCKYGNILQNVKTTHPDIELQLRAGILSTRRTGQNFARSPNDLVLEQTINAHAGNKYTGISSMTNSLFARQRWAVTHSARATIATNFYESIGIYKSDNGQNYENSVFQKQINLFTTEITKNINPFSCDIDQKRLFNLSTGKAADGATADFLLSLFDIGQKQMQDFVAECLIDGKRFDRPVKRNNVKTFADETIKKKTANATSNLHNNTERDLMAKVIHFSLQHHVPIENVLSFPLTLAPPSLSQHDGTMISISESDSVLKILTASQAVKIGPAESFDFEFIEGIHYLSTRVAPPMKYGLYSEFIFHNLSLSSAKEIYIFFDNHEQEQGSLRDIEMARFDLYDSGQSFQIMGENQFRPNDMKSAMCNLKFRQSLVEYLIKYWKENKESLIATLDDKRVFVSYGHECYLFSAMHPNIDDLPSFRNNHIEMGTKIIMHLHRLLVKSNIIIKISNMDSMLVNLIYHMQFWKEIKNIVIETGVENKILQVDVCELYEKLDTVLVNALPAWFTFCGNKYESSFYGKGRKSNWRVLNKNMEFQQAFGRLGQNKIVSEEDIHLIGKYTCALYGATHSSVHDVNGARTYLFEKMNKHPQNGKKKIYGNF